MDLLRQGRWYFAPDKLLYYILVGFANLLFGKRVFGRKKRGWRSHPIDIKAKRNDP